MQSHETWFIFDPQCKWFNKSNIHIALMTIWDKFFSLTLFLILSVEEGAKLFTPQKIPILPWTKKVGPICLTFIRGTLTNLIDHLKKSLFQTISLSGSRYLKVVNPGSPICRFSYFIYKFWWKLSGCDGIMVLVLGTSEISHVCRWWNQLNWWIFLSTAICWLQQHCSLQESFKPAGLAS